MIICVKLLFSLTFMLCGILVFLRVYVFQDYKQFRKVADVCEYVFAVIVFLMFFLFVREMFL